jgi:hypothetical protein
MYIKWVIIQVFYWLCVFISVFAWPVTYPFHKHVKSKWNPIYWIIHDNPDGAAWYWSKFGVKEQPKGFMLFWISYNYSVIRNGCWRLFNTILKQKEGTKTNVQIICNETYDGTERSPFTLLRMKFKTDGVPTDNVGNEFDLDLAFQGKNHVKYEIDGTKYWMYSYCKIEGNKGREFTIGWNGKRPLIRNKKKHL